uniref:Aldehyde dehydrogenase domain-containing protein n=1 Tax=Leersia perrieri TaxID=77586 RepID=A0A0D9WWD5_9ORYZ
MLRAAALLRSGSGLRRPLSTAAATWLSDGASSPPRVRLLIGGEFVESRADKHVDVTNPATQEVVSRIPLTTADEFKAAVDAARTAFPGWRNTPVTTRQRIMFKYQELIRANMDKLAENITTEQGKTLKDAWGDVFRGLEVVEHACGMGTLQMGEYVSNVSNGIDTFSIREPLGVCAGICPFNFPAMIPLWMFPIAVTCGNTFVLKPSEKDPGAAMMLAELAMEAGLPKGVLNIVHGTHDVVNNICDDKDIKAVSFVGSNTAGMHIYSRASAKGKRVQSNMGAKNHAIILPDADRDGTLNALIAAGFGAAGQREDELVKRASSLVVNSGMASDADLGPVISKQAKERICKLVQSGADNGARVLLDGRDIVVPNFESGNFVGPTILADVKGDMECYKSQESQIAFLASCKAICWISAVCVLESMAMELPYLPRLVSLQGNFKQTLKLASKASFAGDLNFYGKAGVQFFTQIKTITQQWKESPAQRVSLSMPTSQK